MTRRRNSRCARTLALTFVLAACARPTPPSSLPLPACDPGAHAPPDGACVFAPARRAPPLGLITYFHGRFTDRGELDSRNEFARVATGAGFAVLAPTGRSGLCFWEQNPVIATCWPSAPRQDLVAREIAARVAAQADRAARQLGGIPERFVAGYSNGGFFAAAWAMADFAPATDGYAVLMGGSNATVRREPGARAPMFLLAAEQDPWQTPRMRDLDAALTSAGWPHEFHTRPGSHALTTADAADAVAFFARIAATHAR